MLEKRRKSPTPSRSQEEEIVDAPGGPSDDFLVWEYLRLSMKS